MRPQMMDFRKLRLVLLALLLVVLLFAWVDGGREPQHLIEQEVTVPAALQGAGGQGGPAR